MPPVPAVVAPCDPPDFGCYDRTEGNAPARLVNSLTDRAESGEVLTPDDVRELFEVVGERATVRAGLGLERAGQRHVRVVPGTAYAQAAALRTLLAQSVYPGIAPRFRPVLGRAPVTQAVPFPDQGTVAAGQAARLAAVPDRARQRLVELWRSARDRDGLGEEEIAELAVIYGLKTLERLELRRHPVRALRELLHRSDQLLDAKLRRIEILTARARAGTVLDGHIAWEIAHSWGPSYAAGLHPDEPVLRGPATAALTQDPRRALPAVRLHDAGLVWEPRRDLLESTLRDRHFVGELEDDGRLALRFGDGRHGARPTPGARLTVRARHPPPRSATRCPPPAAPNPNPSSRYASWPRSICAAPGCVRSPPRTTRPSPPPCRESSGPPPRSAGPAAARRHTSRSTPTAARTRTRTRRCSARWPRPWRRTGASATSWWWVPPVSYRSRSRCACAPAPAISTGRSSPSCTASWAAAGCRAGGSDSSTRTH